ncbi:hypothetical protein BZA05DRAFT_98016 [Tricharina praecox]|uniref:uncharacterized protein n=1 Tax=Tricharina praecox TaxID=43433 RepID=UPI00221EB919|nr:uncharacterized protein BZA05DRAFT_98016 [Tricharina praecox]KAI5857506.1 hypothetical protein BZA05DRAFT_98016 [Tricharina praecox]
MLSIFFLSFFFLFVLYFHRRHAGCVALWLGRSLPPVKFWLGRRRIGRKLCTPIQRVPMVTARQEWLFLSTLLASSAAQGPAPGLRWVSGGGRGRGEECAHLRL